MSSPIPLTIASLAHFTNLSSARPLSSTPTLSGDTPVPSPPSSIHRGKSDDEETQVNDSRCASPFKKDIDELDPEEDEKIVPITPLYPEGGPRAWLALLGATLVLLSTFGLSNSFGAFLQFYAKNQLKEETTSSIAWIGSCHLFFVFGSSILSGMGFDRGLFQYQLAIGSSLWVLGLFMLSISKTFTQIFLSQAVCLGIGLGVCFGPVLSCVGTYFCRRRGVCIGVAASGAAMGAVMYPILLNYLFAKVGFAPAVRICAYISTGVLLVANIITRPRVLPPRPSAPILPLLKSFARQPSTWLVCLGVLGGVLGLFIIMFFVTIFMRENSTNPVISTYALPILNACACIGRLSIGLIADRIGAFTTIIPCTFIMATCIFCMVEATSTAGATAFLFFFGISSGGFISIMASCFMSLSENVSEIGLRAGTGFLFVAMGALCGSPIAGAILKASGGGYFAPCCFGGGCALMGCALLVAARRTQVVRIGSAKV